MKRILTWLNRLEGNPTQYTWTEIGQSIIEFAVVLPLFLALVLGTIDLGLGFKTYIGLTNAAREGVRWVSLHPTDVAGAQARVEAEADRVNLEVGEFGAGGYTVALSPSKASYVAGDKVTVTISYEYELLFGAVTGIPDIPFDATATMVVLYDE